MENQNRGLFWEDDEVFLLLLISIWTDEKIQQQLDTCTRKKAVFEKIAKRLKEEGGYVRTHHQISDKIKQLKKKYKGIKDNNNLSGRSRKTFKFFDAIDAIMGDRPITKPRHLFESGETTGETEEVDVEGGDDSENDDSSPSFVVRKAPNDQNDLGLDQSDGDMDEDADTSVENSSRSFDSSETPQQPSASPTRQDKTQKTRLFIASLFPTYQEIYLPLHLETKHYRAHVLMSVSCYVMCYA